VIDSARLHLPDFAPGSVWLVGAGPGDPGLLSALALHALNGADTLVYDALVDPRILELARPGARLESAGKRGGRPSPSQPDISARLIASGRKPEEPVAIVSKATTPAQRVLVSSLAEAAADAAAARIEAPTIIVIGEVVRLRATLDWLGAGEE